MARITREEAEKREAFAFQLFRTQPKLSVAKANEHLQQKFKATMRQKRLYELREGAVAKNEGKAWVDPKESKPGTKPKAAARAAHRLVRTSATNMVRPGPKVVDRMRTDLPFIYRTNPAHAEVISTFLEALNAAGLTNLKVELMAGRDYLLVDTVEP